MTSDSDASFVNSFTEDQDDVLSKNFTRHLSPVKSTWNRISIVIEVRVKIMHIVVSLIGYRIEN